VAAVPTVGMGFNNIGAAIQNDIARVSLNFNLKSTENSMQRNFVKA